MYGFQKKGRPEKRTSGDVELQPRKEEPMPRSVPPQSKAQSAKILRLLIEARGDWVPLYEILPLAAQYSARICELRKQGFRIENKTESMPDSTRHSWFRLVDAAPAPPPSKPVPAKSWEQIVKERDEKMRQPEPSFELVP
jgi:hypothetical protein